MSFWTFDFNQPGPLCGSDLFPVVDALMCRPDCPLHWKIHSPSCRKMVATTFSWSLSKRCPGPIRTTSPKITATSWASPYPTNGWCRGIKFQSSCPNFRKLWSANSVPDLFVVTASQFSSSLCGSEGILLPSLLHRGWSWEHFPINFFASKFLSWSLLPREPNQPHFQST